MHSEWLTEFQKKTAAEIWLRSEAVTPVLKCWFVATFTPADFGVACEMLSRDSLATTLRSAGWPESELPKGASAYLLFRLDSPSAIRPRKLKNLTPHGSYQAVSCTLEKLHACEMD